MDKEYELIQNGEQVAATSGVNAFNEIKHYAWQCEHCGPVEVFEVTRRKIDLSAAPQVVADERPAFFAWFAENGAGHAGYKEAQDVFVAGYRAAAPVQPVAVLDGKYGRLTGDNIAQPVQMKIETK